MNLRRTDLPYLKWPLLVLLAALSLGTLAVTASREFARRAQNECREAQIRLGAARTKLAGSKMDRNSMQSYRLEYGKLLEHGVMEKEQRLDWMEDMEKLRRQHGMPGFSYTISPQHSYALPAGTDDKRIGISASEMTLQLDLLHGGQLMDFLGRLRSDTRGWFILDECSIERMADTDTDSRLKATCSGNWLTMNNKKTI